jgi:hypothetical protein
LTSWGPFEVGFTLQEGGPPVFEYIHPTPPGVGERIQSLLQEGSMYGVPEYYLEKVSYFLKRQFPTGSWEITCFDQVHSNGRPWVLKFSRPRKDIVQTDSPPATRFERILSDNTL